ncbi:Gluconate transport-inducing protein, partial [Linderina pennispora]
MTESYHGSIDTARDALLIFEACNLGYLPRVQRRFSERERQTIRSGAVYIWDEEETGMRRWTDGRTWSPSRVHGCFLIYYELEGRRHQFVNGANNRNPRYSPRSGQAEASPLHASYDSCPPNIMQKEQGLIKKALSLCTSDKRKLHLVCYYSREDVESGCLTSPSNDPRFANIQVCEDRYPEIGHGSSRGDRYNRSRLNNQQRAISVGSTGAREGPPAYVRSSMAAERRSPRSYRSEVYRYPSYGPYAGPVRHVQVPVQQAPLPQTVGPAAAPMVSHAVYTPHGAISAPRDDRAPQSGPLRSPTTYQPSSSTPYIQHPHSYPASPWPVTPQPSSNQQVYAKHASSVVPTPSSVPSTPAALSHPAHPVWQHSEPPKAYASGRSSGSIHPPPPGAQWDGNTKGLMIHLAEPNRSPATGNSASSVPPTPSVHYSEHNAQQKPRVQPQPPQSAAPPPQNGVSHLTNASGCNGNAARPPIRLPPISKLDVASPICLSSGVLSTPCSPMANMKLESADDHMVDPRRVVSSKSTR